MLGAVISSLMSVFHIGENQARDIAHHSFLLMHGRNIDPNAFQHYWWITARNEYFRRREKASRYTDLLEYKIEDRIEEETPDDNTSQILDRCQRKLDGTDRELFKLLRYGYDHQEISTILNTTKGNIRIMKYRLIKKLTAALILLLVPLFAFGQSMELTRPADFRYYVTVDSDTMSSRSLDYKAIQDAVNYRCMYPESQIIVHPIGITVDRCPISATRDTVIVRDTVMMESKYYDNNYAQDSTAWHPNVQNFDFEIRQAVGDTINRYQMAVEGTTDADHVSISTNCYGYGADGELIRERSGGRAYTDLHGFARWESDDLYCRGVMTYWLTDNEGHLSVWFADIGHILYIE